MPRTQKQAEKVDTSTLTGVRQILQERGITVETRPNLFREGVTTNTLPAKGVFEFKPDRDVAGSGEFLHLRIGVKDTELHSVSTSAILAGAEGAEANFAQAGEKSIVAGTWYLRTTPVNPTLGRFSPVDLVEFLDGKAFTATPVTVKQLPYVKGGWTEKPSGDDLRERVIYKITLM